MRRASIILRFRNWDRPVSTAEWMKSCTAPRPAIGESRSAYGADWHCCTKPRLKPKCASRHRTGTVT